MNTPNNDRPPLKNILPPGGTFVLKLIRPKDDKINARFKLNAAGFASCNLFFLDGDGNCMTKNFSVQWGKGLAMVVGKFTGKFCPAPPENMTVENLFRFVEPAFGMTAKVEMEVTENGEWQGKPQYRYKFVKIEGPASEQRRIYGPRPTDEIPRTQGDTGPDTFEAVPF